ncbi:MAG: EutN/CcmL family microcompartment protein [Candidatus Hydrogenedentes bacterium]|nr:EutN/CcmL family microcompartment protein [Candidatus Hydrogenedentota bacterium]
MQIGRIAGTVVSTAKEPSLEGRKLLVVKILDTDAKETGGYVVAVDAVGAGIGEVVLVASGSSARLTEATRDRPSDAVIMAIVDSWDIDGAVKWRKHER